MRLTRFEWGCLGVAIAAFVVRLTFLLQPNFIWDSAWFLMLARSFGETGTFYIPWSEPGEPQYSGYWPPLFPIFVSPFVKVFGPHYATVVFAAIVASALLVTAVFFTTRDLFDRPRAFAATALIAASPAFYSSDSRGMSESLLGLMVVLTVWAFIKSLEKPIWLPVAGVFAFLAYLGKASLGLPFVAAGVLALAAWRIYRRGWRRVLRSPVDVSVAVVGIVGFVAVAMTRTERVGGLGLGLIEPLARGFRLADCGELIGGLTASPPPFHIFGPQCWALAFPLKILFVAAFLFVVTLPLSLRLPAVIRQPRTERTDALWLATLLPIVAGAVFTTTFFFTEHRGFVDFDNIRYLTPALVPFIWLTLPVWTFADEPAGKDANLRQHHAKWYWTGVGALVVLLFFNPLTGAASLGRFFALVLLSLIPIGISIYARSTQYGVVERRVGTVQERRFIRMRQPEPAKVMVIITAAVLAFCAYFYSAWYAGLSIGLIVALATPSPTRRVVAFALIILASAAPHYTMTLPVDSMSHALSDLPEGTLVGMGEIIAFGAGVVPDNVEPRLVDLQDPIPPDFPVLVTQGGDATLEYPGFTRIATWDYEVGLSPTLEARIWIEVNLLGQPVDFPAVPGYAVYVREGSGLEDRILV